MDKQHINRLPFKIYPCISKQSAWDGHS